MLNCHLIWGFHKVMQLSYRFGLFQARINNTTIRMKTGGYSCLTVEENEFVINRFRSNWSLRKQFHLGLTFSRALNFTRQQL
jgi:hypothetical protein